MFGQWTGGSNARHRGTSLTTVLGLVVASFVAVVATAAPANAAVCQDPQNNPVLVGGFEIDGNLCQNNTANSDWDTVGDQPVATDAVTTQGGRGTTDTTAFTGGADETNGPNWSLGQTQGTLSFGDRDIDLGNIYAHTQVVGDNVFAFLGFERQDSGGAISVKVELNQKPNNDPSCAPPPGQVRPTPNPCRTPGDLLLVLDKQGGATPVTLSQAYTWDPTRVGANGTHWIVLGNTGAVGRSNNGTIRTLDNRELRTQGVFGEVAVNLTTLFGPAACSGSFGTMNVRTSNSPTLTSSLADWVAPIHLGVPSTCPSVVLQKHWVNGANGDRADLSINGATQGDPGFATSTANGNGDFTDTDHQASVDVEPGSQVNLAETLHSGNTGSYDTNLTCNHDVTPNNGTITVPGILGAGDTVTCTFTNTRREAILTFTKNWASNSTSGDEADLRIETPGGTTGPTTSTAPDSTSITRTVFSGEPVTVVEELGANASSYRAVTVCSNNVDNLNLLDFGASFTVPNTPGDITCTITNTPVSTEMVLTKNWVNGVNGVNGDTAGLTVTTSGATGTATATVPSGGNGVSGNAARVPIVAGQTVTLSEMLPAPPNNRGVYQPTALRCNGTSIPIPDATAGGATGTFTVPSPAVPVTCEFTNEARYTVHLTKQWGVGSTASDTAVLTVTNQASPGSSDTVTATAPDPPELPASVTAAAGNTINLSEVLNKQGAYDASLSCDNGVNPSGNGTNGSFTMPSDLPAGTTITCTFLNESRYTVELTKAWGPNAVAGNTAHLTIRNANADDSSSETAIAPNPPATPASVTASPGDVITLDEAFGDGNAPYNASLSCDAGRFTTPVAGTTGEFQVEPGLVEAGGTIHCTFTNTRQTATVVLQKHWNNAASGDSTDLSINGATQGDPGFATSKVTNQPTFTDRTNQATATVQTGDQVTVSENMGANTGSYDTVLSCDDGVGELPVDNGSFKVTAAMAGETVTCTFDNTRQSATVVLRKHWNNGSVGDSTDLSITGGGPPAAPTVTSMVTENSGTSFTDRENQTAVAVHTGDRVTVSENMGANTGSYDTVLSCDNGVGELPADDGTFTVTAAMAEQTVTCTFTNTRQSATVVLRKHWNNGAAGDSSTLTITGGEPNPSNPTTSRVTTDTGTTFTDRVNQAAVAIQTGDQVTVSENMANGNTGSYDTVLSCDNGIGTLAVGNGTFRVTAALAAKTVTCTFTNTRQRATVVLQKRWANAATGDRAALRIAGGTPNPAIATSTVTTATGPTFTDGVNQAAAAIHTGDVVTLTENLPAANTARYAGALACNNGAQPNANGTFTVTAAMAATTVTCTFTNTRQPATLSITKTSTATRITPGARVPYTLRVRNTGPSVATNVVVRDTLPRGLTFVSSTPRCTAAGQVVTCNLGTIPAGGVRTINMVTRAARPFPATSINTAGNVVNAARVTSPSSSCPAGSTRPACNARAALPVPRSTPHVRTATSRGRVRPGRAFFDRIRVSGLEGSAIAVLHLYGPFSARTATTCTTGFRTATKTMRVRNGRSRFPVVRVRAPGVYTWRVTLQANARNRSATHPCGQAVETTVVAKPAYKGPVIRGGFTGTLAPSDPAPAAARPAPVMIRMPAVGMNAPVIPERVLRGHMVLPAFRKVGWLKKSDNFGDKIGSVVVGGHVSSFRDVPGAMFHLKRARAGQLVTVTKAGKTYTYKVTRKVTFSRHRKIPHKYFTTTGRPRLVMVSCVHKVLLPRGRFTYTRYIIVVAKQIRP